MTTLLENDPQSFIPDTSVIRYMRAQSLPWAVILKELIDNGIDAGARTLQIRITPKQIRVVDDGSGCPDLMRMIRLGGRADYDETQMGQYGVGLKDAAIVSAKRLTITSVCEGTMRTVEVDWDAIMRGKVWRLENPIAYASTAAASGTSIILDDLLRKRPSAQPIIDDLGRTYMPWLNAGGQLHFAMHKDEAIAIIPYELPRLQNQQTQTFTFDDRWAKVTMGIVPKELSLSRRGLLFIYGPRVIASDKRLGIAQEALSELYGWIEFSRGWTLEKNKQDFTDNLEPLEDAIAQHFAALIQQASHHHVNQPLSDIQTDINHRLKKFRMLFQGPWRKARRPGPPKVRGTVEPTGTGSTHKRARVVQPGHTFPLQRALRMQYAHLGVESDVCKLAEDVILLNEDAPMIAQAMSNKVLLQNQICWAIASYLGTDGWLQQQMELPWRNEHTSHRVMCEFYQILSDIPVVHELIASRTNVA